MLFAEFTNISSLLTNPIVVWSVFILGVAVWGIITAATLYHWRKYRVNQRHGYGLFSVYWLGSGALILLAAVSLSTHLYV